jgi:hypothetical protein
MSRDAVVHAGDDALVAVCGERAKGEAYLDVG